MPEQLRRRLPLVAAKLPRLARGEDGDDAAPVVGLELLGGIDKDEAQGPRRVDGREQARDVQDCGSGAGGAGEGAVWRDVGARFEERFDVRHAQERRG